VVVAQVQLVPQVLVLMVGVAAVHKLLLRPVDGAAEGEHHSTQAQPRQQEKVELVRAVAVLFPIALPMQQPPVLVVTA
jgi:putative copper export protein